MTLCIASSGGYVRILILSFPLRTKPFPLGASHGTMERKGDLDKSSGFGVLVDDKNKVELRQVLQRPSSLV